MSILDYHQSVNKGHYAGYASIGFRYDNDPRYDIIKNLFILNSCGDGWFRKVKDSGPAAEYGICIQNIKITSKTPRYLGSYAAYKCKINYIGWSEVNLVDIFWLFVHKDYTLEEVLKYIEENKHNWIP